MKKNLQLTALAFALAIGSMSAQTGKVVITTKSAPKTQIQNKQVLANNPALPSPVNHALTRGCGTLPPSAEWDAWFNKEVEKYIAANSNAKIQTAYTIPVVFHIIHTGQAVGTYPNLAQGQVNSQVTVLNQDYMGTGLNYTNCPTTFTAARANTQISFCLATKSPTGGVLAEPGIDRIACSSKGWTNPASFTSMSTFQSYVDGTIKPNSIWDPTRYFNVWVTDCNSSVGLLGYATFPAGTGLVGLSGFGTVTTDGVWVYSAALGSNSIFPGGTYAAPYNKGRTLTHESGHWLGLRHIWGDGTCATDYCNDTPPAQQANYSCTSGCTGGCFTHPYQMGVCSGNTTGDMTMNFMDYTDDACMYMFTNDQNTRIQTAMSSGTYRSQLSTSASTLCVLTATAPIANFSMPASGCVGSALTTTNNSTGVPTPTYSWSSLPSAGVTYNPNSTATAPSITFGSAGSYVIKVTATNSLGTSSYTQAVTITTCAAVCKDTITNVLNTDTLRLAVAGTDTTTPGCSPKAGYIFGSNCYSDQQKAEFFASSMYSAISTPKITDVIVLFFKKGSQGTGGNAATPVNLILYNGTMAGGPTGTTTPIATCTANLGGIVGTAPTTSVTYCGKAGVVYSSPIIIPYKYHFSSSPSAPTTNGFFASLAVPNPTVAGDTAVVMSDNNVPSGTNWEYWSNNTWNNLATAWGGFNASMAIIPIISCSVAPLGIVENELSANVTLMPNPTTGQFNIVTTLPNVKDIHLTVTNAIGQLITEADLISVRNGVFTVDLSAYNNGIYFITLQSNGEKVVKKVVLNK